MSNNVLDQNRLRQVFFIIIILLLGILLSLSCIRFCRPCWGRSPYIY